MNEHLIQRVRQCPTLPTLPAIAIQVLELAQKDQVDIAEIARVISKDPALSSKILRTVNSSFYQRSQAVSTITHALVILGLQSVKTLVLGFSLVPSLSKNKAKGFKHITYWRRSIYSATAARTIAAKVQLVQAEECFLAALLQDIGMLVLDQVVGEPYGQLNEKAADHNELVKLEAAELGMTHAEVSGVLAETWKLPPVLTIPMALHHRPAEVTDASLKKLTEVLYLAGRCADVFVDENAAGAIAEVRSFFKSAFGVEEKACDELMNQICKRTKEVAPLFEIPVSASLSYDAVLKKANETLIEITLRSQQQAHHLKQENQQLQIAATTDGLTGLANRARFDGFLREQFEAARSAGAPLAMLLMDMDKFKSVNDKHGHPAGDAVLRHTGKLLASAARKQDLAARYGGEELVLILPGTSREVAAQIAETIRRAIAARAVPLDRAAPLSVTASIGVAVFEPGGPLSSPAHLIKAADLAMYNAKCSGRNCVRVFALKPAAKPVAA